MWENLLRHKKIKYLVFDTETEGLNLISTRPWQIAFILAENENVLERHNYYINWPDLRISEGAAKTTGFDLHFYKAHAKESIKIWRIFEKYLYNPEYIPVCHNLFGYDAYIVNVWRLALGLGSDYSYLDRSIDSNSVAKMIKLGIKELPREEWKLEMFKFAEYTERGLKTSISTLCKEFNIDYNMALLHKAEYDIELNIKIWNKLKWMIEI